MLLNSADMSHPPSHSPSSHWSITKSHINQAPYSLLQHVKRLAKSKLMQKTFSDNAERKTSFKNSTLSWQIYLYRLKITFEII